MDNLTHSLTGLALARAGLNRFSSRSTLLLIVSANAPDADIVWSFFGPLRYFEVHRGYTHSLICLPIMALLSMLFVAAVYREKLPWIRAGLLCVIGVASHLLLDWTNSYGIRLLLPFSSRWFYLDLNNLYDAWILTALLLALILPIFSRLVYQEIGAGASAGRGSAIFALAFFLLFDAGRLVLRDRAIGQLESRLYDDHAPLQAAALPGPFNPFKWTGIVETAGSYQRLDIDCLTQLDASDAEIFYKPSLTGPIMAAEQTEPFRYLLYFSRFPVWSAQPASNRNFKGTRLDLTDLRFGVPGGGAFHSIALTNNLNQVIGAWFTYGSGTNLGWTSTIQ